MRNWLRELQSLLLVALAVTTTLGLANAIVTLTGAPFDVGVPAEVVLRPDALVNAQGAVIDPEADVYLRVEQPTTHQALLATAATLPGYALAITMLVLLWRLVRQARRTDPFTGATVRRLRALGWLLIVGGPAVSAMEFMARFMLSDTVTTRGAHATLDLSTAAVWFLVGVGVLGIGEVIHSGQAIRAELDEVV